jgi:hypothetical protein
MWMSAKRIETTNGERSSVLNVSKGRPINFGSWEALRRKGRDDGVVDVRLVGYER